ncbi:MAG: glycine cleavage system aminomethyltransferase GcvT [Oscillospiraceae bacterium]|jgi:aminomethyltransferase|nr:glycine cleavage system aminomethyltransferase GcvT [Oscillospiraceae bacterium]
MEIKTALYELHIAAGGKMVPFAGYSMPVQYGAGVIAEHKAVRAAAGLFDVSHMGEFTVTGSGAFDYIQQLLCNDYNGLADGGCRYSPMLNDEGGVVDDLIVYRYEADRYMIVVNASNRQKDWDWMAARLPGSVSLTDESDKLSEIALQGPRSEEILSRLAHAASLPKRSYTFADKLDVAGAPCIVSRTGYTGEDGFELYTYNEYAPRLWEALLDAGSEYGLIPCGLGARDTLRLEAAMPLYGHELSDTISPLEAGLGSFVKMDKPDFIGKSALIKKGKPARLRMGLRVTGKGIAREGCEVFSGDTRIGVVTSGTLLPHAGYPGAMALIDADFKNIGAIAGTGRGSSLSGAAEAASPFQINVDVRGRRVEAEIIKLPFYKRVRGGAPSRSGASGAESPSNKNRGV